MEYFCICEKTEGRNESKKGGKIQNIFLIQFFSQVHLLSELFINALYYKYHEDNPVS